MWGDMHVYTMNTADNAQCRYSGESGTNLSDFVAKFIASHVFLAERRCLSLAVKPNVY